MNLVPTRPSRALAVGKWLAAAAALTAAVAATASLAQPPSSAQPPAPAQPPAAAPAPSQAAPTPAPATPPAEFAICAACHEVTAGAGPSLGPNLFNIGGRKAGSTDFDYSTAMKSSGITWTADTLQAFVVDPAKVVPGNKMDYPGADAVAAKAIVDYLMSLKG